MSPRFFLLSAALCLSLWALLNASRDIPLIPTAGPVLEAALSARDIWEGRGIEASRYYALEAELERSARETGATYWQDIFAAAADGRLVTKHPLVLPLLAAPWYGVFGTAGFWLFSLTLALFILRALRRAAEFFSGRDCGALALLGGIAGTQTLFYSYALSYDLLAAALSVCGFELMLSSPLWGAFVLTASCLVRPIFVALALPIVLLWALRSDRSARRDLAIGSAAGLALLLAQNCYLWGGPFTTAYHRFPYITGSGLSFPGASMQFSAAVFAGDWGQKLFGAKVGLLTYDSGLLALLALPALWRRAAGYRVFLIGTLIVCALNAALVFSYLGWQVTGYGNRYLFGAALIAVSVAIAALAAALPSRHAVITPSEQDVQEEGSA